MRNFLKFSFQSLWNFTALFGQLFPDQLNGNKIRGFIFRPFFKKVGRNFQVSKSVHILYPKNIEVGDNVFIGFNSWINGQGGLCISNEVMIGPFCAISTSNHTKRTNECRSFRFGEHELNPVLIQSGVWVGSHVSITAGSIIQVGTVVGAGAVVIGELGSDSLYTGTPAKLKRKFHENN